MFAVVVVAGKAMVSTSLDVKADLIEANLAVGLEQLVPYLSTYKIYVNSIRLSVNT